MIVAFLLSIAMASEVRVVSFSPAVTETLFDLELGEYIVGTSDYSNYPPEAKNIPSIGGYTQPNMEKVIVLQPDFIITEAPYREKFFKRIGIETIVLKSKKITDYKENILLLKQKFPKANQTKVLEAWNRNFTKLATKSSEIPAVIQLSDNPVILAGRETLLDSILSMCRVKNLFEYKGYKRVSREVLWFLSGKGTLINVSKNPSNKPEVKNVNPDLLSRLTLRMSESLHKICSELSN